MAINVPVIVSVVEVGSPTAYLRVTWDHDITGSPATDGYLIEWDYDNPAWNPSWIVPPAVDLGLLDGDGKSPVRRYTVLINLSNAFVSDWETFEEYAVGNQSVLSYGGSKWAGPAVAIETDIGYKGFGDDFESYSVGQHSELGGGKGWASPAEAIGMGDFDIVMRTISGVDDQRVVVDNTKSPWVRTMAIGDDWTKIRFAMRWASKLEANWTSPPYYYFGLCAGSSAPPGSTTPNHFVGVRSSGNNWIDDTNDIRLDQVANIPIKIESGVITNIASQSNVGSARYGVVAKASYGSSLFLIEIEKGSPNWTINGMTASNNPGARVTVNELEFAQIMNSSSLPSDYNSNSVSGNTKTFAAPDEGTYGDLDTICFAFLGSTDGFEISDIAYARLA